MFKKVKTTSISLHQTKPNSHSEGEYDNYEFEQPQLLVIDRPEPVCLYIIKTIDCNCK